LKMPLKGADSNQEKTLCGTQRPSWTPFQKMRSRSVSNNGGTAGISVCVTKGTTLKEIRVNLFYMYKCIFANQGSILIEIKDRTMDGVQNCDSYINIPSSQTYVIYIHHTFELLWNTLHIRARTQRLFLFAWTTAALVVNIRVHETSRITGQLKIAPVGY
jgi:hypothetical protein